MSKDIDYLKGIREEIKRVTDIDLVKKSKRQMTVDLRAIYCRIALDNTNLSDLDIANTMGHSRTMVSHYVNKVFPYLQKENKKVYEIYLCLCEGINLEDFKKANLVNLKHKFNVIESQLETIKSLNKTSVIDLRAYINTL